MSTTTTPSAKRKLGLPLFIIGSILLVVGLVYGPMMFASAERDAILKDGIPAAATVIKITDTGNRFNDNPEVVIELQVFSEDGTSYVAEIEDVISVADLVSYPVGTKVEVRIDREDPTAIAIVGSGVKRRSH